MLKSHDQRCLDSNRFGDGFDCNCEPDWQVLYKGLEKKLKDYEPLLEACRKAQFTEIDGQSCVLDENRVLSIAILKFQGKT
jgi:hypothetical protein